MSRILAAPIAATIVTFWACVATAAFTNGVESFPGTVKDTLTWGQSQPAAFTQNNGLTFSYAGGASYNTIDQTVSWGQAVRIKAASTSVPGGISLFLTNNSVGPNGFAANNSAFWSFDLFTFPANESAFTRIISGTGSNGTWGQQSGIFNFKPSPNHPYVLEIKPLSLRSAQFSLFESDGATLIESRLLANALIDVPNTMHISIEAGGGSAFVYYVAIVPEPSATSLAIGAATIAIFYWRNARRRQLASN